MAHTKSALKRIRQDKKRNLRNQSVKSTVRTATRTFRETLEQGDAAKTQSTLRAAVKTVSKAASKGVLRKQTAARRISRLARAAHKSLVAAK
ncbi:MAG TPA: 30S ribosomal protein S20 [Candidatus Methanoperedens sp.]|nr:30S ribosomal protein S20 [Candidatus Methanoperedens sp.]